MEQNIDRQKAVDFAISQIERQHGKGAILHLNSNDVVPVEVVSTGSLTLDIALGVGGVPRGRIVEIYGHEATGKTTLALHMIAEAQKAGTLLRSSMLSMHWIQCMPNASA